MPIGLAYTDPVVKYPDLLWNEFYNILMHYLHIILYYTEHTRASHLYSTKREVAPIPSPVGPQTELYMNHFVYH